MPINTILDLPSERQCTRCKEVKPSSEFDQQKRISGSYYLRANCKSCKRRQHREWAQTERGKQVKRNGVLAREYGVTESTYNLMLQSQDGRCAICRQHETKRHWQQGTLHNLVVDHDHKTGSVRSLLCSACNAALGLFKESPENLRAAADYLERHLREQSPGKAIEAMAQYLPGLPSTD